MIVEAWLPRAAALRPDGLALRDGDGREQSWAELGDGAMLAAADLHLRGVRAGDRVGIVLPAGHAFARTLHGALLLGAVAVPVDPRLAADEVAARTATCALVVDAEPGAYRALRVEVEGSHDADAVALVVHTSGTSGAARPVELTYGNVLAAAQASAQRLGETPDDRWLGALPVAHVGGLSILLRSAIGATAAVLHERFDAAAHRRELREGGITGVSLVPTTLARLLDAGLDRAGAPDLRVALLGGAPAPAGLLERAIDAGIPVAQTYGMTEACSQVTTSTPAEPWTAGTPLPGTTVEVAPDGEILVAGATVAPGAVSGDGWLHTGDLGALDEQGRLTVIGRRAETIITGGENVAPAEVEAVLLAHPDVADAGVLGRPDPEWGEAVTALVVLRDGAALDERALREHCAAHLARFKVPKAIEAVTALPRTASGKLLRRELG